MREALQNIVTKDTHTHISDADLIQMLCQDTRNKVGIVLEFALVGFGIERKPSQERHHLSLITHMNRTTAIPWHGQSLLGRPGRSLADDLFESPACFESRIQFDRERVLER